MRRKGFSVLNTVVSMVVIASVLLLVLNFNKYTYKTLEVSNQETYFLQEINNKITDLYTIKDWDILQDESIPFGEYSITIHYMYNNKTKYNTEKLDLKVAYLDNNKFFTLERNKLQ